jgi:hypothetical protein
MVRDRRAGEWQTFAILEAAAQDLLSVQGIVEQVTTRFLFCYVPKKDFALIRKYCILIELYQPQGPLKKQ